jgi:HlyD family secretion protein
MKRKLLTLGALLAFAAILGWAFYPKPVAVDVAEIRTGRFERRIEEDGRTRLREHFVLSAPVAGRLARVTLREGDAVQLGQVVATLWPADPALLDERRLAEQREQVAAAEAGVQRAQAGVARAEATQAQAEADLQRSETLAARGFISANQVDNARLAAQVRQRELEAALQERNTARHQLAQLRIALRPSGGTAPGANRPWPVRSPVAGKVLRLRQQSEAVLPAGAPLIEVGDPAQMEVLVDLLTEDAAQVRPGAMARLTNWGGPALLEARVRLIEPSAFTKVSALGVEEQRVNVLLDIVSPPAQRQGLGDHYKVDVSLPVLSAEAVTLVPVGCLFPRGSRQALFVLDGGRARLQEVELVARNGQDAWIRSTLRPGTQVIAYPPASLRDGDRVRAMGHEG